MLLIIDGDPVYIFLSGLLNWLKLYKYIESCVRLGFLLLYEAYPIKKEITTK